MYGIRVAFKGSHAQWQGQLLRVGHESRTFGYPDTTSACPDKPVNRRATAQHELQMGILSGPGVSAMLRHPLHLHRFQAVAATLAHGLFCE